MKFSPLANVPYYIWESLFLASPQPSFFCDK
jgi:hypothetical protein